MIRRHCFRAPRLYCVCEGKGRPLPLLRFSCFSREYGPAWNSRVVTLCHKCCFFQLVQPRVMFHFGSCIESQFMELWTFGPRRADAGHCPQGRFSTSRPSCPASKVGFPSYNKASKVEYLTTTHYKSNSVYRPNFIHRRAYNQKWICQLCSLLETRTNLKPGLWNNRITE